MLFGGWGLFRGSIRNFKSGKIEYFDEKGNPIK
jgi:hypothetical protein